jgi:phosphatidylserine/phosphatidylglycerophosphate/cardiolipin synthase-like enzyme
MDALLIATGFTGALTLAWLCRKALAFIHPPLAVTAHFSPGGGCTDAIVREIAAAKREILMLAYGFTSRPIAQALIDAKLRAVEVHVILDHSNEKEPHTELPFLLEQKLEPLIDTHHAIAHNKVILIDGKTLITGSFNFTQQAEEHNAENLVIIKGHPDLCSAYRQDFNHHKSHARKVEGASSTDEPHAAKHDHHDILTAVAQGVTAGNEQTPDKDGKPAPVTTPAAAEMLARLKKEVGAAETTSKAA